MQRQHYGSLPAPATGGTPGPRPFTVFRKAVFDQWSNAHDAGPTDKDTIVTGNKAGGTEIRPIREG